MTESTVNIPTVTPADPFNPKVDAELLKASMKGDGANETAIIAILTRRTSSQRQAIKSSFKELFAKDLVAELKTELGGQLEAVILALMMPMYDFLAQEINHAVKGVGTDEADLVEIICSASNEDMKQLKASYAKLYGKALEKAVKDDTSGDFKKLLMKMCLADRDEESSGNEELAKMDAKDLMKAGVQKVGTDEHKFIQILTKRSYPQLKLTFDEYKKLSNRTLIQDIEKEFSGDIKEGLIAIIKSTVNKPNFYAERLNKTVKGVGTQDRDLIRIVVTRSEIDLGNIKREYTKLYGKSIENVIAEDISGDYKRVILGLLHE